jgi:hypothetical protein
MALSGEALRDARAQINPIPCIRLIHKELALIFIKYLCVAYDLFTASRYLAGVNFAPL